MPLLLFVQWLKAVPKVVGVVDDVNVAVTLMYRWLLPIDGFL